MYTINNQTIEYHLLHKEDIFREEVQHFFIRMIENLHIVSQRNGDSMKQYQIRSILIGCMLLCLTGCTANSEKKRDVLRVGVVLYTQDDPLLMRLQIV